MNWFPDFPDRRTMAAKHADAIYLAVRCPGGWKGQTNAGGNVRDIRPADRRAFPTRKAAMTACERHAASS